MGSLIPRTAPGSERTKKIAVTPFIAEKIIQKVDPEPETVQIEPPKPLPPLPTADTGAGDEERRKIRRRRGRQSTFLTGNLIPQTTKKPTLG